MAKEHYHLTVEPITCVHIGSGKQLSPLDCIVVPSKSGRMLYATYSSDSILHRIASDKRKTAEFEKVCTRMKDTQEFFHQNFAPAEDTLYKCHVTDEFKRHCAKHADTDPLDNAQLVAQMYRPEGSNAPVIPGSSLKGAIRTAILNQVLDSGDYPRPLGTSNTQVQKQLLNNYKDVKQDPFRALEIGDCVFEAKGTQLVGILKNIKKNKTSGEVEEHNTSLIQAEVIKGSFMDNAPSGTAHIRINMDLGSAVSKKITKADIISACNRFYLSTFEQEYKQFYKEATGSECDVITELYKEIKAVASSLSNSFILRVGRWSQVEFVTLGHDLRNPKTPKRKGKIMPYGTTRTVLNYDGVYLPLGWCKCTVTALEEA